MFYSTSCKYSCAWLFALVSCFSIITVTNSAYALHKPPKLIVAIVIDQFRADYLTRFESRFLPSKNQKGQLGGFKYLMTQGAYFPMGEYDLMQSITAPGHASILTGSYPYQSGIVMNEWFDIELGKMVTSVEDKSYSLVGPSSSEVSGTVGCSPHYLNSTTVGDELKNAGFPSKVVSISLKDRSAILLGGHRADLAIWYDSKSNQWVSSRYYLPKGDLPDWLKKVNQNSLPKKGQLIEWKAEEKPTGYSDLDSKALNNAINAQMIGGLSFPHSTKFGEEGALAMPLGVELTEKLAEEALKEFKLGQGPRTDVLAVSFSSHDAIGHAFGPNSLEMEELTVIEDRILSRFLNFVKKSIPGGLSEVVIVLTADHGAPPSPDWAQAHQLSAGRIHSGKLLGKVREGLDRKFGKLKDGDWVSYMSKLQFFMNWPAIESKKIGREAVENEVKSIVEQEPGIAYVFSRTDYLNRKLPPGIHERQILHSYYKGRSGDVIGLVKPYFIAEGSTTTHMTGYSYDRTVPIIFSGLHIRPGTYATRAEVVDIAPTLSFLGGVIAPSLSEGRVLSEILNLTRP